MNCLFILWSCQTGLFVGFFLLLLLLLSRFSRVRLCATHRWQPTRLPVPGILQARTLEWVAISFSNAWKWKVKVKSLSRVRLLGIPWTEAHQVPPSMGFSRQKYWSGVPLPSPFTFLIYHKFEVTNIIKPTISKAVNAFINYWCNKILRKKHN